MPTRYLSLTTWLTAAILSGCGTMNSNFSCNVTARDSCLTIEEVDAMTHFADDVALQRIRPGLTKAEHQAPTPQGIMVKQQSGQSVWLAKKAKEASWA